MPPGRPPKLRTCARCGLDKPRRGYNSATADVCNDCKRDVREQGGPRGVTGADLSSVGQYDAQGVLRGLPHIAVEQKVSEPVFDALRLDAMTSAVMASFKPLARCQCCWEYRHVGPDRYGGATTVCARCDYQIRAVGACHLHHGPVVYPELAEGKAAVAVPSPPEVEALFVVTESTQSKYDPAELADADA